MNMLVLGANSEIATSIVEVFARNSGIDTLYLASRDTGGLAGKKRDIEVRGLNIKDIQISKFDALSYQTHRAFYDSLSPI